MRLLVLGGTVFLGRHVVDAALAHGHDVTIFHRGRHPAPRAADVCEALGDRTAGFAALAGRDFDAVIDTCGYLPADVERSARGIAAGSYVFVSSASVYADLATAPVTEDTAVLEPPGPQVTDVHGELYGPQKAGCERALRAVRGDTALVVRAGLLVGPHDATDRFTYWATRFGRPGPVLAPAVAAHPVQFLDARDLADWMVRAAADRVTGTMNASGPRRAWTFGEFLQQAAAAAGVSRPDVRWVDEQLLIGAGVQPWSELPLWVPTAWSAPGVLDMTVDRAFAAGLTSRPLVDTLRDVVAWAAGGQRVSADYGTRASSRVLTADREAELLARLT
ncbi:NAD-dependent epimerase/dehydratase family protein [Nakamurella deserti]|uniref:NAD-dependent epimerase/dehydratase family protein n=1 Tax=Nakamurella deserti TaxID=2164074 RepID=UPI001300A553|nr:NAD-dependent epimerase/dehydratase family protein [Nakamurella deserti]